RLDNQVPRGLVAETLDIPVGIAQPEHTSLLLVLEGERFDLRVRVARVCKSRDPCLIQAKHLPERSIPYSAQTISLTCEMDTPSTPPRFPAPIASRLPIHIALMRSTNF